MVSDFFFLEFEVGLRSNKRLVKVGHSALGHWEKLVTVSFSGDQLRTSHLVLNPPPD